jgi:hypothetical protein
VTTIATYVNAVTDRLVVSLFKSLHIFLILSKDHQLKGIFETKSTEAPPSFITDSIFSSSTLVCCSMPFVLVPLNEAEAQLHFNLNYGFMSNVVEQQSEDFNIVYQENACIAALQEKIVGSQVTTDIQLLTNYVSQKPFKDAVYFYQTESEVTILAIQAGQLKLANRYPSDNTDETFYYVMLVIEQLEMSAADLHFECITTKGMHETYFAMFKNYVNHLHLSTLATHFQSSTEHHKELETLAYCWAQCV